MQQVIMMSELLKEYPGVGQMQLPGDIIERPIFPTLHIRMLGTFIIASDRAPLTGIDMPRLQSLLAYLVQHHGVPQSRTRLASLLWPDSTEEQAHTNLRNLLYKLRQALPEGDYQGAIRIAQRLQREDPLQEASYRHLMRLYAASGNRAAAVRTYQRCVAVLERELAVEPGPTTHRVYEQLIQSKQPRSSTMKKRPVNDLETTYAIRSEQYSLSECC
jgi:DNA-binding SARP family transcriptional activator